MGVRAAEVIDQLRSDPPPVKAGEVQSAIELLEWLNSNHFTFLGYRNYALVTEGERVALKEPEPEGAQR